MNNIFKIYINDKKNGIWFLCIITYPDKLSQLPALFILSEIIKKNNIMKEKEKNNIEFYKL